VLNALISLRGAARLRLKAGTLTSSSQLVSRVRGVL
jgi:hypothetical protein